MSLVTSATFDIIGGQQSVEHTILDLVRKSDGRRYRMESAPDSEPVAILPAWVVSADDHTRDQIQQLRDVVSRLIPRPLNRSTARVYVQGDGTTMVRWAQ